MQIRSEQLDAQLQRGLARLYTVMGDEPLLAQEAGDAIRSAARQAGCSERKVFSVSGAHYDWSAVLGAAQAMSLFSERQLIEIRVSSGKPGKDGGEALQRYCAALSDDIVTLVQLPRLDSQQMKSSWFGALEAAGPVIRVETIARDQLPAWLAQRLARQQQRVMPGDEGQRALALIADRVEGNLLAAHQELLKLALLHGPGELAFAQIEAAVLNVARYDIARLSETLWSGRIARTLRMLDGLQAEGESAVFVHWTVSEDLRTLLRARQALDQGKPLPLALKEARAWGVKERLFERVVPVVDAAQLAMLVQAASICDGLVKGLRHPDWPGDPWDGLKRLLLMVLQSLRPSRHLVLTG